MKYQQILFSRSINKDYRWMITSTYLTDNELHLIEDTVWSDALRSHPYVFQSPLRPVYHLNLSNASVVIELYRTNHKDSKERFIDALQGVVVKHSDLWYMRFALPWLLTECRSILNIWEIQGDELAQADNYTKIPSQEYLFDYNALNQRINNNSYITTKPYPHNQSIDFNEEGMQQLIALLSPNANFSSLHLQQFAFGVLPQESKKFHGFNYIAYIGNKTASKPHRLPETMQNPVSPSDNIIVNVEVSAEEDEDKSDFNMRVDRIKKPQRKTQPTKKKTSKKPNMLQSVINYINRKK